MSVFSRFRSYGFIHHRALNDFQALAQARATVAENPGRTHIYEGDLCWDFENGREELYFRHPSYVVDTLSPEQIGAGKAARTLVTLEDLETLADDDAYLVVELKVGRGDTAKALAKLILFLDRFFPDRFWIDGFSTALLRQVKAINPDVTVTLHTECVLGRYVVAAAPEWPPVRIEKMSDLSFIDGIAIRWRLGPGYMSRASAAVLAAGKSLLISRIHDLEQFDYSLEWRACAGYAHYDFAALAAHYDAFAARGAKSKPA